MSKKLGIFIVHGMGSQTSDYAEPMMAELQKRLKKLGCKPDDVAWQAAYWAKDLANREHHLWEKLYEKNDMDFIKVRQFVVSSFGDALAYQRTTDDGTDIYSTTHEMIRMELEALRRKLGNKDAPIVVIAHSLGSVIMSNYIWDQQHPQGNNPTVKKIVGKTPLEQMKTLAGLITFGSNIALFSLAHTNYAGVAFPPQELDATLKPLAKWNNYYDPDDVLGYPVKPLCNAYETNDGVKDHAINAGGILSSWNPASHSAYWTDNDFTVPVARQIAEIVKAI